MRDDLFADLLRWEDDATLVLALGTSMCGMNADRLAESCSKRAAQRSCDALGTVIVNLQQTVMDDCAALRIFAPLDHVFSLLAEELGYPADADVLGGADFFTLTGKGDPEDHVFKVPYDAAGVRIESGSSEKHTFLDLRVGAKVKCTAGPYAGCKGEITQLNRQGHYQMTLMVPLKK